MTKMTGPLGRQGHRLAFPTRLLFSTRLPSAALLSTVFASSVLLSACGPMPESGGPTDPETTNGSSDLDEDCDHSGAYDELDQRDEYGVHEHYEEYEDDISDTPDDETEFADRTETDVVATLIVTRVDTDGDGVVDTTFYDYDGDGNPNAAVVDKDGDGIDDERWFDSDDDGDWDRFVIDYEDDGVMDAGGADWDGDDKFETFWWDDNGNGKLDTGETFEDTPDEIPGPRPEDGTELTDTQPMQALDLADPIWGTYVPSEGEPVSTDPESTDPETTDPAEAELPGPPCEGAVLLSRAAYWQCVANEWHFVDTADWQCPDGSVQTTEVRTNTHEPCNSSALPEAVVHDASEAYFDSDTCPVAMLLSEVEEEVCEGGLVLYRYSSTYGCADGSLTTIGDAEVVGECATQ